jgi:hypothetical protein
MPVVFRFQGARFHFYANEGSPLEPVHIHVTQAGNDAKFWLHPNVQLAYNYGFSARELTAFANVVEDRRDEIERAWHGWFG